MNRHDAIRNRHAQQRAASGLAANPPPIPPPSGRDRPRRALIACICLIAFAAALSGWWLSRPVPVDAEQPDDLSALPEAVIPDLPAGKASGTGFFITPDGWLLTAAHVVANAGGTAVVVAGSLVQTAQVIRIDNANDVAILKCAGTYPSIPLSDSTGVQMGDAVFTVGFPFPDVQGYSPKMTRGEISSLAGRKDDPRHFQISAPIQPGNSGGPLVDERGAVVGIVVSRLLDQAFLDKTGLVPQNVNYAIKGSYILPILEQLPGYTRPAAIANAASTREAIHRTTQAAALVVVQTP